MPSNIRKGKYIEIYSCNCIEHSNETTQTPATYLIWMKLRNRVLGERSTLLYDFMDIKFTNEARTVIALGC